MRPGDVVDGRFEIERLAGAGAMGLVYRARDRETGEPVALKLLQRTGAHQLGHISREAQALAMLRLPGVVRYVGHGVAGAGYPYLAMEWLTGETLEQRLAREALSFADCVTLAESVAQTLGAIHRLGLVHRDIKPSNLMLVDGEIERVMLIDFGVVRDTLPVEQHTGAGMIMGTPGYMAPEQAQGEGDIDARADVFSLGCVLFECLTGRPAFVGDDPISLLGRVILEEPPRAREINENIPVWLDRLVARMLVKKREQRPRDGDAVAAAIGSSEHATSGSRPGSQPSIMAPELTASEQEVMALVLVAEGSLDALDSGATLPALEETERSRLLRELVEAHGGRLELAQAQWMLIVLSGAKSPTDLATRAARCAQAVQAQLGSALIAIVTGRAEVAGRLPVGRIIDRAVRLLPRGERPTGASIRIDEVTAGLLGPRFLTVQDSAGFWLWGALRDTEAAPRLLGRTMPFVGRERELQILLGELGRCIDQRASTAVLVTAQAGLGKSRLRREFLRAVLARGDEVEVWFGQVDPMSAGSSFGLVAHALRRAMGILEGERGEARCQKVLARVARHSVLGPDAPRIAAFLGELVGAPFPDDNDVQLRAARRNPLLMGDQIRLAWEDFLCAECAAQPVVLVLEDLHWGDLPTVNLIEAGLRHAHDLPFLVLALGSPEVRTLFPKLWQDHCTQVLHLTPLLRRAGERLVREALGADVSAELVAKLVTRADGNVFILEEQIRAAAEGRTEGMPETVLAMVQARFHALHADARRALRAASIFGETFWQSAVEALLGGVEVAPWLQELERCELIVRYVGGRLAGEADYRFRHALVREAAYGMLTERDRRLGHALAGDWLERVGGANAMALVEHFILGGTPARAAEACLRAAEEALRGNDLDATIQRAQRGVECGPGEAVLGALRWRQAEAHVWRGDVALAEQRGLEALERIERGTAAWFSAANQALNAMFKQGAIDRLEEWLGGILGAPVAEGALVARNICLSECAVALIFGGRTMIADTLLETIAHSIGENGENGENGAAPEVEVLARLSQARAFRITPGSSAETCLASFQAALAAFEQAGDRRNACTTQMNVGFCCAELGDFTSAESALRTALADAERMALHEVKAWILENLGLVLAHVGKHEEGRAAEAVAIAAARQMGQPRLEGAARAYLARIALLTGDFEEAEREARAAAEILESAPPLRAHAMAVLARALIGLGRNDRALAAARDAWSTLRLLGAVDEGESLVRLTYAEALAAAGMKREAASAIASARDSALARADKLRDPARRACFLEGVPENARTLELARVWLSEMPEETLMDPVTSSRRAGLLRRGG